MVPKQLELEQGTASCKESQHESLSYRLMKACILSLEVISRMGDLRAMVSSEVKHLVGV